MSTRTGTGRSSIAAALLSLLLAGLGQLYAGRPRRAAVVNLGIFLLGLVLLAGPLLTSFAGMLVAVGVVALAWLANVVDAVLVARRAGPFERGRGRRWALYLAVLLVVGTAERLVLNAAVRVEAFRVAAASMAPALLPGDHLYAEVGYYDDHAPQRGEVAVYTVPGQPGERRLARVVAVGGETVDLRDKRLFVDGEPAEDPWARHMDEASFPDGASLAGLRRERDQFGPYEVPEGMVFLLGDNRDRAFDSRFVGAVPRELLEAKALYVYWSNDRARIGRRIGGRLAD